MVTKARMHLLAVRFAFVTGVQDALCALALSLWLLNVLLSVHFSVLGDLFPLCV